jgi:hypothetical protein
MLSAHFSRAEFACRCGCGVCRVSDELLSRLEAMRERAGIPLTIVSGCRCHAHNAAEGGREDSAHLAGFGVLGEACEAADIVCANSRTRFRLVRAAFEAGFTRIEDAPTWIHVDVDATKDQEVLFRT